MKVFVSYGYDGDQVNALRLQALGAVNGFQVYVPPAYTRQPDYGPPIAPAGFRRPRLLDPESGREIGDSDIVLGVIGSAFTDTCRLELGEAHKLGKPMIVMTNPGHAELFQSLGWNVVQIDPSHPERAESEIVRQLKAVKAKPTKEALLAFGTLALGLLAVAAIAPQE